MNETGGVAFLVVCVTLEDGAELKAWNRTVCVCYLCGI